MLLGHLIGIMYVQIQPGFNMCDHYSKIQRIGLGLVILILALLHRLQDIQTGDYYAICNVNTNSKGTIFDSSRAYGAGQQKSKIYSFLTLACTGYWKAGGEVRWRYIGFGLRPSSKPGEARRCMQLLWQPLSIKLKLMPGRVVVRTDGMVRASVGYFLI